MVAVGPVRWMSPENIQFQTYSEKSDVWAWGATAVEIYTLKEPYPSLQLDLSTIAWQIRTGEINPLQDPLAFAATPSWFKPILASCFEMDPQQRPTFEALCRALEAAAPAFFNRYESEIDEDDVEKLSEETPIEEHISKADTRRSLHPLSSGDVRTSYDLSNLELQVELGRGSFGVVHLGTLGDTPVAVKQILMTGTAKAAEASTALFREATVMASIPPHRNVIGMYGLKKDSSNIFLVMEFASRGCLEESIKRWHKRGAIPEAVLFRICLGIARGMAHLARNNIVHRGSHAIEMAET